MKVDWKLTTSCTGEGAIHTAGFYPVNGGGGGGGGGGELGTSTFKNSNCSANYYREGPTQVSKPTLSNLKPQISPEEHIYSPFPIPWFVIAPTP